MINLGDMNDHMFLIFLTPEASLQFFAKGSNSFNQKFHLMKRRHSEFISIHRTVETGRLKFANFTGMKIESRTFKRISKNTL